MRDPLEDEEVEETVAVTVRHVPTGAEATATAATYDAARTQARDDLLLRLETAGGC